MKDQDCKVGDMVYFISDERVVKGKIVLMGDYWAFVSSHHEPMPYALLFHYPDDVSKVLEEREKKEAK